MGDQTHPSGLDPADWASVRAQGHRMLDDMFDYLEHIRSRPVWQPIPDAVRARFDASVPRAPTDLAAVHADFMRDVLPFATGNVHPGFMGWVHGGGNVAGMLAEMLAAGLNANLGGRDHAPIEVERQITRWAAQLFGFPQSASGLFVTGTSMANMLGVLIARADAFGHGVRRKGIAGYRKRPVAYTSAAAHGCIARAMDICGLGSDALRSIPTNARHQVDCNALTSAIAADRAAGLTPFLIVGTAGTVDIGAIDDLAALADIAEREALWFHIDGAFGALAILATDLAPRLAGIERADSLALDFHKWGQVPYDAGFILVRDGERHRRTFAAQAAYLRRETRGLAAGAPWPCDFGPDLSRGFRALKTWFTLKVYGTDALGAVISSTCALARHLERRIRTTPQLELLAPVELNIVCFRHRGADADTLNARIVADLQESGIAAPSTTTIEGRLAIRAAIVNHRTQERDVDALVDAVVALGAAGAASRRVRRPMTIIRTVAECTAETPPVPLGLARLSKLAFDGNDFAPLADELTARALAVPPDPAALMDLSIIAQLTGRRHDRVMLQKGALSMQCIYRQPSAEDGLRLLAFMAPGDFLANTPLEFMLQDTNVTLDMVYVVPGSPLPQPLPAHDVAIVAATELAENRAVLDQLAAIVPTWPRPVLNAPNRIARLTRDGAWALLHSVPGTVYPVNVRIERAQLTALAIDTTNIAETLGFDFPIIVRPVDSHAGHGLALMAKASEIGTYLNDQPATEFFVAPFIDYRGADGLYRKYRVAFIDGQPYACHMAISHHWMIHYLNAGMLESAAKRAEEARFMAEFDGDFAQRHAGALAGLAERMGLDYVTMDCAETRDGRLLVFEVGNGMIVHAMDPPGLFPYKAPQMRKVFDAFEAMLRNASARRPAAAA